MIEAAQVATRRYGTGVTGSRLLNGTLDLHRTLEAELAEFYEREAALVFSTGYVANVSTISGLLNRHDYVVLDKDAHNSLLTGAQLSGATMKRFGHNDVDRLGKILDELPPEPGKAVIVDGVYSMGGDTAPLAGPGRAVPGAPEHVPARRRGPRPRGPRRPRSRCGRALRRARRRRPHHHHLLEDARLVRWRAHRLGRRHRAAHPRRRPAHLHRLEHARLGRRRARRAPHPARAPPRSPVGCATTSTRFVGLLTERGVPVNPAESAIITIPLRQRDEVSAVVLARELLDAGVFVNPVVAPAVPRGLGLIRLSLMLDHTPALLEEAAESIFKVLNDNDQLPDGV